MLVAMFMKMAEALVYNCSENFLKIHWSRSATLRRGSCHCAAFMQNSSCEIMWRNTAFNPSDQCHTHIETSQLIYTGNRLTSFYLNVRLAWYGLKSQKITKIFWEFPDYLTLLVQIPDEEKKMN